MPSRNEFLDKYRELENQARHYYRSTNVDNPIAQLINDRHFANVKDELIYCREVRNLLSHKPKLDDEFLVNPSKPMVELLGTLLDRLNKLALCMDYAIRIQNVYACSMDDLIRPAMQMMKEKNFTHVPILENGKVIGVFSENTLFSYVLSEEIIGIEENSTFQEIEPYLAIDGHITETFRTETFRFLPREANIFEAKELFVEALKKTQRIGMIFLTETGKQTEKLLAIITPWDFLGNQLWI
jgi:CBS domain-containing protein